MGSSMLKTDQTALKPLSTLPIVYITDSEAIRILNSSQWHNLLRHTTTGKYANENTFARCPLPVRWVPNKQDSDIAARTKSKLAA